MSFVDAMRIDDLLARVEAIEARQRADKVHDPDCGRREYKKAQKSTDMWLSPDFPGWECDCWLSEE